MRNPIIWLLAAGAALFFAGRGLLRGNLQFRLQGIKIRGSILQPIVEIAMAIQNPTRQRAKLRSVTGEVYVDDKFIANISFFGETIILPNAETIVLIQARPSLTGAFSTIQEFLSREGGRKSVALIKGSANVDGITYPFEVTRTI